MIKLDEYVKALQAEIATVPGVSGVRLFGSTITEEEIKKIPVQPNQVHVLLTVSGGGLLDGLKKNQIDSDVRFGAYVTGMVDPGQMGYSGNVMSVTQRIMKHIKNLRINNGSGQPKMPDFKAFGPQSNVVSSDSAQTSWFVVWDQRLSLDLD